MLACALPARDGLTGGQLLGVAVAYGTRSRWSTVAMQPTGSAWDLRARGSVSIRGFELEHRGRLDLSGADIDNAERLRELVNGLSTRVASSHLSLHVTADSEGAHTLLTLEDGAAPCEGWRVNAQLVRDVVGLEGDARSLGLLERWSYVRTSRGVARVVRVGDFTAAAGNRALLEQLQRSSGDVSISLHFDVVGAAKAQRTAARAVHRMGSDGEASRAAGFRRTARSALSLERLAQREELVVGGQALMRVGVFVVVRADSIGELRLSTEHVLRSAEQSGLRIERGVGRQLLWFCFQLPGGPGW